MKKITVLFLCVLMLLGVTACSKKNEDQPDPSSQQNETAKTDTDSTSTDTQKEETQINLPTVYIEELKVTDFDSLLKTLESLGKFKEDDDVYKYSSEDGISAYEYVSEKGTFTLLKNDDPEGNCLWELSEKGGESQGELSCTYVPDGTLRIELVTYNSDHKATNDAIFKLEKISEEGDWGVTEVSVSDGSEPLELEVYKQSAENFRKLMKDLSLDLDQLIEIETLLQVLDGVK